MRRILTRFIPLLSLAGLVALSACLDTTAPEYNFGSDPRHETFDPSLGIDLAQMTEIPLGEIPRSIWYKDLATTDTGTLVARGDTITFHYTLWLRDGRQLQTTFNAEPLTRPLGHLIAGFQIAVPGMVAGGTRKLVIPSVAAYGAGGTSDGSIPPHTTVIFEVQVLKVGKVQQTTQ